MALTYNFNVRVDFVRLTLWPAPPSTRTTYGDRCFAVAGPRVWNSLPTELRQS